MGALQSVRACLQLKPKIAFVMASVPTLASPKVAIAEKSLVFSNREVQNHKFYRGNRRKITRKSQNKSRSNRNARTENRSLSRFQNRRVFGTLENLIV